MAFQFYNLPTAKALTLRSSIDYSCFDNISSRLEDGRKNYNFKFANFYFTDCHSEVALTISIANLVLIRMFHNMALLNVGDPERILFNNTNVGQSENVLKVLLSTYNLEIKEAFRNFPSPG